MSPQAQAQAPAGGIAGAPSAPGAQISVDFRRLGTGDIVAGVGTLLVFISVFLPWYTYAGLSGSLSDAGGWRILILVLSILTLIYIFLRSLPLTNVRLPMAHWQLLTGVLGLQFLLILIAFIDKPGGAYVGWGFGSFFGLVVGLIALAGGILRKNEPEHINPAARRASLGSLMPSVVTATTAPPQTAAPTQAQAPAAGGPACARCGSALTPGTTFCTNCGAPIA
jgi:hypothetical protein